MVTHTSFQFEILYSPNLVYKPGDVINGILHVVVGRSVQTHGAWCNFVGKCIISCSDASTLSKKIIDSQFSPGSTKPADSSISQEVYVNQSLQLLPGHNGNSLGTIVQLPFQFVIPLDIPSSFSSPLGYVAYKLVAFVPLTTGFKHVSLLPVTMNKPLNPQTPVQNILSTTALSSPGLLTPLKPDAAITLHLSKQGYAPGKPLEFTMDIKFRDKHKIASIVCTLVQSVIYNPKAKKPNYMHKNVVSTDLKAPWDHSNRQHWDLPFVTSLVVPQVVPSDLGGHCSLIRVLYFLKVKLTFTGLCSSIKSKIPVIIGTIGAQAASRSTPANSPFTPPTNASSISYSPVSSPFNPTFPEPASDFSPSAPPADLLYNRG